MRVCVTQPMEKLAPPVMILPSKKEVRVTMTDDDFTNIKSQIQRELDALKMDDDDDDDQMNVDPHNLYRFNTRTSWTHEDMQRLKDNMMEDVNVMIKKEIDEILLDEQKIPRDSILNSEPQEIQDKVNKMEVELSHLRAERERFKEVKHCIFCCCFIIVVTNHVLLDPESHPT